MRRKLYIILVLSRLALWGQVQPSHAQVLPVPIPGGDFIVPFTIAPGMSGPGLINQFFPGEGTGFDGLNDGGTSNAVNVAITSGTNPVPMITVFDPVCAPVGAGDFGLVVFGSDFVPNSVVRWNGDDRPTTVYGSSQLVAQISASDLAEGGTAAITVFNPGPGGGSSSPLPFTIATGGVGPVSIALDPGGNFAYVANQGCVDFFDGNVSMYTIDSTTGALTSIGTPVMAGIGPTSVAVDPSGRFVYVANSGVGEPVDMGMSSYSIDTTTGALSSTGFQESGGSLLAPWSVAVHPSGKFVYVADEGGFAPTGISIFSIDGTTGTLTPISTVSSAGRAVAVAVDPSGRFAYVANSWESFPGEGNSISMYTVNAITGSLTSTGTIAAGSNPTSIAIDPLGKFAYVTNSQRLPQDSNNVLIYTIDSTTGALTFVGLVGAGTGPVSMAVDPLGAFAYVANCGSNDIAMYTIDAALGTLTLTGTVAAGSCPSSIAIHSSGNFAYVTNQLSNDISMYSIDGSSGALTLIGTIGT